MCEKLALRFPKNASTTDVFEKYDDSLADVFRRKSIGKTPTLADCR